MRVKMTEITPKRPRKKKAVTKPKKPRARKTLDKKIDVKLDDKITIDETGKVVKAEAVTLRPSQKKIVPHELLQLLHNLDNRVDELEAKLRVLLKN